VRFKTRPPFDRKDVAVCRPSCSGSSNNRDDLLGAGPVTDRDWRIAPHRLADVMCRQLGGGSVGSAQGRLGIVCGTGLQEMERLTSEDLGCRPMDLNRCAVGSGSERA